MDIWEPSSSEWEIAQEALEMSDGDDDEIDYDLLNKG